MSENPDEKPTEIIKRKRGRPLGSFKVKPPQEPKIPKKRGRKPKPIDPNIVKRPRGRPRKEKPIDVEPKRRRGRIRVRPLTVKGPRGRPRKNPEVVRVLKYRKLNADWSDPEFKREYFRMYMRPRLRKLRGIKKHIYKLDDGRLWSEVKKEMLEEVNNKMNMLIK